MRRIFLIVTLIGFIGCLSATFFKAQALDISSIFGQLKNDLLNKGLSTADVNAVEQPAKSMLSSGVSQLDLKNIILNFFANGFKGMDLGSLVSMVGDMVKNGSTANSSAGIVNRAIQQASSLGLKGKDLMSKVQSIVNLKKNSLDQLKSGTANVKNSLGPIFGK